MKVSAVINPDYASVSGIYDVLNSILNEKDILVLPNAKSNENYQIMEEMANILNIKTVESDCPSTQSEMIILIHKDKDYEISYI